MLQIKYVEIELPVKNLNRIIQVDFISDIHARSNKDIFFLIEALPKLSSEILLLGGDYSEKEQFIEPLFSELSKRYKRIIAVIGNNDLQFPDRILACAKQFGIELLRDETVRIDELTLVGTKDPYKEETHFAMPQAPALILSHSPDILLSFSTDCEVSVLCGHTHGGQIRFPFWPWWWTHTKVGREYGEGRSKRGNNEIFTSRGIGCSLMKIRNVPKEIYKVHLIPKCKRTTNGHVKEPRMDTNFH